MIELKTWPLSYEAMNTLYADSDQSKCLVQLPVPLDKANTFNFLKAVNTGNSNGHPFLCRAIMLEDRLIGKIELSRYDSYDSELDIILLKEECSKGYGREALKLLEEEVKQKEWCRSIYAYVDTENIAAGKMLAACGYEIGRFFTADVMIPHEGSYVIKSRRGCEMRKVF